MNTYFKIIIQLDDEILILWLKATTIEDAYGEAEKYFMK